MSARKIILFLLTFSLVVLVSPVAATPTGDGDEEPVDTTKVQDKKARFGVKKTTVEGQEDLKEKTADLRDPDNVETTVTYDEKDNTYTIGTSLGTKESAAKKANDRKKNSRKEDKGQQSKDNSSQSTGKKLMSKSKGQTSTTGSQPSVPVGTGLTG